MTTLKRTALASALAGALLLAGGPAQAQAVWTLVPSPNEPGDNFLLGVDATDAGHVWAVGRQFPANGTTSHSLILRNDGSAWRPAPQTGFPPNSELYGVDAVTANDAWAVGYTWVGFGGRSRTLAAHWDGAAWTAVPTPNASADSLNNLAAVAAVPGSPGSVWAVGISGESAAPANRHALILRRAGGTWRVLPAPRMNDVDYLTAVDATGPNDAWAVGSTGGVELSDGLATALVLHWNGTAWRQVRLPAVPGLTELYGVEALAPNDVWVVGQTAPNGYDLGPFAAHFDGTSWRQVAVPAPPFDRGGRVNDIVALSPTDIYAVGATGQSAALVVHWNGSSWSMEPTGIGAPLTGAAVVAPRTVWAVGSRIEFGSYFFHTLTVRSG
jgi:hypothetical protein